MRPTTVWIRLRKCKSARKRKRWRKWRRSWIRMTMRVKDLTMTSLSKWVRSGRCQKWKMFFQTWITRSHKMARVKGITRECSFCDYLVTLFYFTTICRTRLDQRFSHSPETQKAPEHSAPNALPLLTPTEMARSTNPKSSPSTWPKIQPGNRKMPRQLQTGSASSSTSTATLKSPLRSSSLEWQTCKSGTQHDISI